MTQSRVVLLDIGNSGGKWLLADECGLSRRGRAALGALPTDLGDAVAGALVLIASVAAPAQEEILSAQLEGMGCTLWFAKSRGVQNGLVNAYREPERLGVDRWLAILAASYRANGAFCVVDAGTALTIDFVSDDRRHQGGYIIPGSALMVRALFSDTQRVRYDASVAAALAPGCSTAEAVANGSLLAQAGAIRLALDEARGRGPDPRVFLCGGAAVDLASVIGTPCTLVPDLVLYGLLAQAELEQPRLCDFSVLKQVLGAAETGIPAGLKAQVSDGS